MLLATRKLTLAFIIVTGSGLAATTGQAQSPPAVGTSAADFTLERLDGTDVRLSDLLSKGPVALVVLRGYPGYQCPVCTRQVGDLISKAPQFEALGARVVLVYPGPDENLGKFAAEFVQGKTLPGNFEFLVDPGYRFTSAYNLRWDAPKETAYPSTFVIGPDRVVRYSKVSQSHGGRAPASEVLQSLSALGDGPAK